jgi:hypothetical protein
MNGKNDTGPIPVGKVTNTQMLASNTSLIRQRRKRDRSSENFRKRWRTLVKTLRELHHDYGAEFHVSMTRKLQGYVCRSRRGISPLVADDIVRRPLLVSAFTAKNKRECITLRKF